MQVYLHEKGITISELAADVEQMVASFRAGQRLLVAAAVGVGAAVHTVVAVTLCKVGKACNAAVVEA